jgi:sec-independent protein translocase protein TatA
VNIFGIGLPEMAVIMVLALLVFGPKKLPEIGRSVGKAIRGFQEASKEFETEFKREAEHLEQVVKAPMEATLETPTQPTLSPAAETTPIAEPDLEHDAVVADAEPAKETAPTEVAS